MSCEHYYYGHGVDRNLKLSRKHAETAARLGDAQAKELLKRLDELER